MEDDSKSSDKGDDEIENDIEGKMSNDVMPLISLPWALIIICETSV